MEKNNKISNKFDIGKINENTMQEMFNEICEKNKYNVLEVIYSGYKSNIDEVKKKELVDMKIDNAVKAAYPEYRGIETDVDSLFLIFTELLQFTPFKHQIALGKMLQYIDYTYNNREVELKRNLATHLLKHMVYPTSYPFEVDKDIETLASEMNSIKNQSIKASKRQIDFANKYPEITSYYRNNTKVEIDLINELLSYLKKSGKGMAALDSKISTTTGSTKNKYINLKKQANEEIQRNITTLVNNRGRGNNKSILVDFLVACSDTFIKYFESNSALNANMKWFIKEYLESEYSFEVVNKPGFEDSGKSALRYKMLCLIAFDDKLSTVVSDNAVKHISYESIDRTFAKGLNR